MTDNSAARMSDSPVVAIMNGKGGTGKSTMALGLCAYTGQTHGAALLVDCDPQATAYELTELLAEPGYEVVHELNPAELARIKAARGFDLVAVDCPGSLEGHDVLGTVLQWTDYALVPYDHEMTSLAPTIKTCRYIEEHGTPYAVVVNNVDPRLGAEHLLDAWKTLEDLGIPHFRTAVRRYRAWSTSLRDGVPITRYTGKYATNARADLAGVMTELLRSLP